MEVEKSLSSEEDLTSLEIVEEENSSQYERNARARIVLRRRTVVAWAILTLLLIAALVFVMVAASKKKCSGADILAHWGNQPFVFNNVTESLPAATSGDQASIDTVVTESLPSDDQASDDTVVTESVPFGDVEPPTFSKDILQGYASKEDFEVDLTNMAKYIAKNIIMWNVESTSMNAMRYETMDGTVDSDMGETVASAREGASSISAPDAASTKQVKENKGTMTNNQEKSADEADMVKSDDNFIYAGFSTYVLVMSRTGSQVTKLFTNASSDSDFGGYAPLENLRALFITNEHVVIVTDIQEYYENPSGNEVFGILGYPSSTRVTAYIKPTVDDPDMRRVKTTLITGYYMEGLWMTDSNSIQILTSTDISVSTLTDPLNVQFFPWMSKEDYIREASELAEHRLIPAFVHAISERLAGRGKIPEMLRLNTWGAEGAPEPWQASSHQGPFIELLHKYMQITSINVNDFASRGEEMEVFTAAFFAPSHSDATELYGADDSLVISMTTQGGNSNLLSVVLLHSKIVSEDQKIRTQFHSVKMFEGNIRSRFSLDIQGNDLRIATTKQGGMRVEDVLTRCGDQSYHEDPCITDDNWNECVDTAISCPAGMFVMTGCPAISFTCEYDGSSTEDFSSTHNYIIVYDIELQGEMTERGHVRIGEPYEDITAVRFNANFAYMTTNDPFYILELQAGQAPAVKASIEMEGFTLYLSPLNEEQTFLVGIGQNTSGYGWEYTNSVVMISVLDVSDPSSPKVVDRKMLTQPDESTYSSFTELDSKSIRYENGKLIVPASIQANSMIPEDTFSDLFLSTTAPDAEDIFEGFVVFNVGKDGIQEAFRVNHYFDRSGTCFPCDYPVLDSKRSFLYDDGALVTIYNSKWVGTNITTGVELWSFDNSQEMDNSNHNLCCY
jgi:Beta propeller domain